jgi:sugar transferase EpsL
MKRVLDIIVSTGALICLAPVFFVICLLIWRYLGKPILFCQQRPGLYGKPFIIYKFRTMALIADQQGEQLSDENRMTTLGALLRKYSLDELPQLINVLKGDLSLIGPRPLLMEYLPLYSKEQAKRHSVRPGISGWAQVNGRNAVSWEERFAYDIWYVENRSLLLDMKIILMTIKKLLQPQGISQEGSVTMEKFKGQNAERSSEDRDL